MLGSKHFRWCEGNPVHETVGTSKIPLNMDPDKFDDPDGYVPIGQILTLCPSKVKAGQDVYESVLAQPSSPLFGFLVNHFTFSGEDLCHGLKRCLLPDIARNPPYKRGSCLTIRKSCCHGRVEMEGSGPSGVSNLVTTEGDRAITRATPHWSAITAVNGSAALAVTGDFILGYLLNSNLVPLTPGQTRISIVMPGGVNIAP